MSPVFQGREYRYTVHVEDGEAVYWTNDQADAIDYARRLALQFDTYTIVLDWLRHSFRELRS